MRESWIEHIRFTAEPAESSPLRVDDRCLGRKRRSNSSDKVLDRLDTAIKEYLTSLDTDALDDTDHRRLAEILAFATNLEHAGNVVEKSLMPFAAKRIKHGVSFSEASRREIQEMVDRLISNARAAAAIFMTEDPRAARLVFHFSSGLS